MQSSIETQRFHLRYTERLKRRWWRETRCCRCRRRRRGVSGQIAACIRCRCRQRLRRCWGRSGSSGSCRCTRAVTLRKGISGRWCRRLWWRRRRSLRLRLLWCLLLLCLLRQRLGLPRGDGRRRMRVRRGTRRRRGCACTVSDRADVAVATRGGCA